MANPECVTTARGNGNSVDMEMHDIVTGNYAPPRWIVSAPKALRIVDWNIDRGQQLLGVTDFLVGVNADILILQEADLNARRTHRLNIAETIARKLEMNYVFGREFQELAQGSKDSPAYHGQATLSKWPISKPRLIRFSQQSHFWQPRWFLPNREPFQERLGGRIALVARMPTTPARHLLEAGRHIDWAFVRGPVQADAGKVHRSVRGSDHYPISFELRSASSGLSRRAEQSMRTG
jgi:endonuclease/exonuclease/phosphatase family metal-dependent hydrolase